MLWTSHNQTLLTQDTAKLISSSENLQLDIQRLATDLDVKLVALEAAVQGQQRLDGLLSINHLKATVTSAATGMSSKTTVMSSAREDVSDMPDYLSDFGDWFQSESSVTTLQWIYSDVRDQPLFAHEPIPETIHVPPLIEQIRKSSAAAKPTKHGRFGSRGSIPERSKSPLSPTPTASDSANDISSESVSCSDKTLSPDSLAKSSSNIPNGQKSPRHSSKLSIGSLLRRSKRDEIRTAPTPKEKLKPVQQRRVKIVAIGDGACGKPCFIV